MRKFLEQLDRRRTAVAAAAVMLAAAAAGIHRLLSLVYADVAADAALFLPNAELAPEPAEQQTYLLFLALALPVFALAFRLTNRRTRPARPENAWRLPAIWAALSAWFLFGGSHRWLTFVAGRSFDAPWKIAASLLLAAAGGVLLFRLRGKRRIGRLFLLLLISAAILQFTFSLYLPGSLKLYFSHHFEVLAFPAAAAARGGVPLHQYGFWPNFLAVLWQFIPLTTFTLNCVLMLLSFGCVAALLEVLRRAVRGSGAFLIGGMLLVWLLVPVSGIANGDYFDPYFAYLPIRVIFPALNLLLFLRFLERPERWKLKHYAALGALGALGVFWNPDNGIVTLVCWLCFLAVEGKLRDWKRPLSVLLGAVAAGTLLWLYLGFLRGKAILPEEFFRAPRLFAANGFFMIPLAPLPAAWGFFAMLYTVTLGIGVIGTWRRPTRRGKLYLFLSLMGLGLAGYYIGRSHDLFLRTCMFPAELLLGVLLDDAARLFRFRRERAGAVLTALPVLLTAGMFALNLLLFAPSVAGCLRFTVSELASHPDSCFREEAAFIRRCADGRPISLFGPFQGFLLLESGCPAALTDSGENEILLRKEALRLLRDLAADDAPLFVNGWSKLLPPAWIDAHYELRAVSPGGIRYYEKRQSSSSSWTARGSALP